MIENSAVAGDFSNDYLTLQAALLSPPPAPRCPSLTKYLFIKTPWAPACLFSSLHLVDILHGVEFLFVPAVSAWPGLLQPRPSVQYLGGEAGELVITQGTVRVAVTQGVLGQSGASSLAQERPARPGHSPGNQQIFFKQIPP